MPVNDAGYDPRTGTFHTFYDPTTSGSLTATLLNALSVAENSPPEDLPPLADSIDTDALEGLFSPISEDNPRDNGNIRFQYSNLQVTVHAAGEIVIDDRSTDEGKHNVLLLASEQSALGNEACIELLREQNAVLSITFEQPARDRLEIWREHVGQFPARITILDMGETTRSTNTQSVIPEPGVKIQTLIEESDVSSLGVAITNQFSEWDREGNQIAVCFHSLNALIDRVDPELLYKFLHILTTQMKKNDGIAHYHLDPGSVDEETFNLLEPLFDVIIDRTGSPHSRGRLP